MSAGATGAALLLSVLLWAAPGEAPVADAAQKGDADAVRALLEKGADPNAAQADGMTALHWAAEQDDAALASLLLYAGANPEATTRLGGYTALHLAAREGNAEVMAALLDGGSDGEARTTTGVVPLHLAAASGSADAVNVLLQHGVPVDPVDDASGRTPLMFAAGDHRLEAMKALLAGGADPSLTSAVVDYVARAREDAADARRRATILAAEKAAAAEAAGQTAEVATSGAVKDPAAELKGDDQPPPDARPGRSADVAPPANVKDAAPVPGSADKGKADADAEEDAAGAKAAPAKKEEPKPLSYADLVGKQGGMTALHYAAREGDVDAVRLLLDAGADVNEVTAGDHSSPLLVAAINGNYDLAMMLLDRGADPNLTSDANAGPLFATLNNRWAPKALYPQPTAFKQQKTSYLDLMQALLDKGAEVNIRLSKHLWYTSYNFDLLGVDFGGATPFWRAAYATDVDAMKLLVAHGADPNIPTRKPAQRRRRGQKDKEDMSGLPPVPVGGPGVYPIHAASGVGYGQEFAANAHRHVPNGWLPAVKYLVEELGADVNQRDFNGYTPLHDAAARGDNDLIQYLVGHGADVTVVSRAGQTTADMANGPQQRVQPFPETVALLEKLGAKNNHNCVSCD
jgi:ankyrin repeat protein